MRIRFNNLKKTYQLISGFGSMIFESYLLDEVMKVKDQIIRGSSDE